MILLLETSTLNCSVALGRPDGSLVLEKAESDGQYLHAERLHTLIDEALREAGLTPAALTAIAVGRGPGSFTGLRIGVSAAKGMCVGLGIPLLAPCPLQALRHLGMQHHPALVDHPERVVPAIDARRMELYTLDENDQPAAVVVDATFRSDLGPGPAVLVGDGAEKCADVLAGHPANWVCLGTFPTAAALLPETAGLLARNHTESVADFEPFYLKDFVPGRPKDPLGLRAASA